MTTPRTAAGRRHVSALVGLLGGEDWWTTSVLAIEDEARAAALDEARAALLSVIDAWLIGEPDTDLVTLYDAAIDALRRDEG